MPRVALVTDSTHYLPRALAAELELHEVSLYVTLDHGTPTREADIQDYGAFYESLRGGGALPTTSQPSVGDFLAVYEPLLAAGRDIVSVHLSGAISGTLEGARAAAEEALKAHPDRRIELVDSRTAAGGIGLLLIGAAAAAARDEDVDAVAARARPVIGAGEMWFAVDTLEYLRRGGRIGAAQAWLGGALKVRPILAINGEIRPIERVRTSRRAFDRLVELLRSRRDDGATAWALQHIQAFERAAELEAAGREIYGVAPLFNSEVGPVIGSHVGPGLLGVAAVDGSLIA